MSAEDTLPVDRLTKIYMKIRQAIQKQEQEVETLKAQQAEIATALKEQMRALGVKSLKTDFGTVMLSLRTKYHTHDWDSFKEFVVKNNAMELVERRISQSNMATFLQDNPGLVPPGLNSDTEYAVSVRKPT